MPYEEVTAILQPEGQDEAIETLAQKEIAKIPKLVGQKGTIKTMEQEEIAKVPQSAMSIIL